MRAGELRHRVYVIHYADTYTAKGDRVRQFQTVPPDPDAEPDDYAAIEALKGRELVVAHGMRADLSHKVTMRYRRDIGPGNRLGWVQADEPLIYRIFELGPMVDRELRGTDMTFYAVEIQ